VRYNPYCRTKRGAANVFPIDFLTKAARVWGDATAVEAPGLKLSFRELLGHANALARGIQRLSGRTHPCVAVLSPNSSELFLTIMAAHAGGFRLAPLNPRNAPAELREQVLAAAPDVLICDPAVRTAAGAFSGVELAAGGTGTDSVGELTRRHLGETPEWVLTDLGSVNACKFTGGSSGKPKAVLQTFRNFNTVVASIMMAFRFDADERYLVVAPMTHGAGMFMMPVLASGGCCVLPGDPSPAGILEALERDRITATWMPPTLLYMLLDKAGPGRRSSRLRHLIWGGASAAPDRLHDARAVFGDVVEAVYGQTEASTIATAITAGELARDERLIGSVGRPTPLAQIAIAAPSGETLGPGEPGEILIRGDLVMAGYLGMPEVTAETIRDGWLHTGDVGYLDDGGYLHIKDRIRDVIISGGFNIYPSDVEAALARHPAVQDCVVFGVADEKWGERVEAAVELRTGASASEDELVAFARDEVGSVKTPKRIHLLARLPRSPVGKVLRREVKSAIAGVGAAER
jgi:fatty-acyl-CoA synthase